MADVRVTVRLVEACEAAVAAPLFALYREFYGQPYDERTAAGFLRERLERGESVVLLAEVEDAATGLCQLYPSFSSVSAGPIWILNDLYVAASARGDGVGTALLAAAERLAREAGAMALRLETRVENRAAQRLYERHGYRVENLDVHYEKRLD